jgi:hypothetical protein
MTRTQNAESRTVAVVWVLEYTVTNEIEIMFSNNE